MAITRTLPPSTAGKGLGTWSRETQPKKTAPQSEGEKDGVSNFTKKTRSRVAVIYGLSSIIPLLVMVYIIQSHLVLRKSMGLAWISCLGLIALSIALLGGKLMKETWGKLGQALQTIDRLRKESRFRLDGFPIDSGDGIDCIPTVVNHLVNIAKKQRNELEDHDEQLKTLTARVKESNEEIRKLSRLDWLTGLFNRKCFEDRAKQEIARAGRYQRNLALAMIDVDSLESYNDDAGRDAGNKALAAIGTIILDSIREVDVAFRYSGEQFAILFPETSVENAAIALDRIRIAIQKHQFGGTATQSNGDLTVTIGASMLCKEIHSLEEFVSAADLALYKAKSMGRNRLVAFSPH